MTNETELLKTAVRHIQLSAGTAGELAKRAQEHEEGLPLEQSMESLRYLESHLREAHAAVLELKTKAEEKLCNTEPKLKR